MHTATTQPATFSVLREQDDFVFAWTLVPAREVDADDYALFTSADRARADVALLALDLVAVWTEGVGYEFIDAADLAVAVRLQVAA